MLLSLAWKNIWRNKLRSLILIGAITFGLAGTIFFIGISQGFINSRNKKVIETQLSHIQIHSLNFSDVPKISDTLENLSKIISTLDHTNFIKHYTLRLTNEAMVSSAYNSGGVLVVGIDPKQDKKVIALDKYIITPGCNFYKNDKNKNTAIIGKDLAKKLQLVSYKITSQTIERLRKIGLSDKLLKQISKLKNLNFRRANTFYDSLEQVIGQNAFNSYADIIADNAAIYKLHHRLILRMQDAQGNITEETVRIDGIFDTQNTLFDGHYIFVKKDFLAQSSGLPQSATNEIFITVKDLSKVAQDTKILSQKLPHCKVQNLYDIDPVVKMSQSLMAVYYAIFEFFILFALSFGIINTMLMAVLERTREIGMYKAIGMNRNKIFMLIFNETLLITINGGILGMFTGWLIVLITSHTGLDFTKYLSKGFESFGVSSVIYPKVPFYVMLETALLVIVTAFLASLYPTWKALKLSPAQALREEI